MLRARMESHVRVVCAGLAALVLWTGNALAVEFKLPTTLAGTLVLSIDANWKRLPEEDLPEGFEDAVGFRIGDGTTMQWLLVPQNSAPPGSGSAANLRMLTLDMKRMLASQDALTSEDLLTLDGPDIRGFYIRATDPHPKAGEWKYMYTGWVAVNEFPVMFNIVWNTGGQTAADRALAAVKGMRRTR
jgi:hypothetical protein